MRKKLSGVKLAHHKNTANTASQPLPLPKRVRIPMSMHIGAPCSPLVKVRDSICVGQKIGDTDAFIDRKSTRLNSSHANESRMPSSA